MLFRTANKVAEIYIAIYGSLSRGQQPALSGLIRPTKHFHCIGLKRFDSAPPRDTFKAGANRPWGGQKAVDARFQPGPDTLLSC